MTRQYTSTVMDINGLLNSHITRKSVSGKFVLIRSTSESILVFGLLRQYPYHANLVEQFCAMRELPASWEHKPDRYCIFDRTYKICGGGYFTINTETKQVAFYGASTAYGKFDEKQLRDLIRINDAFSGFTTQVR